MHDMYLSPRKVNGRSCNKTDAFSLVIVELIFKLITFSKTTHITRILIFECSLKIVGHSDNSK